MTFFFLHLLFAPFLPSSPFDGCLLTGKKVDVRVIIEAVLRTHPDEAGVASAAAPNDPLF